MKYSNNPDIRGSLKLIKMERRKKVYKVLKHVAALALLAYVYNYYFNLSNSKSVVYSFLSLFLIGLIMLVIKYSKYVQENKR